MTVTEGAVGNGIWGIPTCVHRHSDQWCEIFWRSSVTTLSLFPIGC